jgi:2'-5' RNA ligase
MLIRTFISLEIPEDSLQKIIEIRNKTVDISSNVRWEKNDKLHVTLKFLGETDEDKISKIIETIDRITSTFKPISLRFEKFGIFKKGNEPKILWIGVNSNMDLQKLVYEIDTSLVEYEVELEKRSFKPHITLLRFRGNEVVKNVLSLTEVILPDIKFTADKIIFYESKLLPSGSIYKPIKSFYLKN